MVKFRLVGDGRFFDNKAGVMYTSEDGVVSVDHVRAEDVQKLVDMGIAEIVEEKAKGRNNNK